MTTIGDIQGDGFLELDLMKGRTLVEAKVVTSDGQHIAVWIDADELRHAVAALGPSAAPRRIRVGDVVKFKVPSGGTVSDPRWWDTIHEAEWTVVRAGGGAGGWSPWLQLRDECGRIVGAHPDHVEVIRESEGGEDDWG